MSTGYRVVTRTTSRNSTNREVSPPFCALRPSVGTSLCFLLWASGLVEFLTPRILLARLFSTSLFYGRASVVVPLRPSSVSPILHPSSLLTPLSEGRFPVILYCACRTTTALSWGFREHRGLLEPPFTPSCSGSTGPHDLLPSFFVLPSLVRAAWLVSHCAQLSHPPNPLARRDVPLARARAFRFSIPLCKGVAKAALYCAYQ
jgi:hypothetical protein